MTIVKILDAPKPPIDGTTPNRSTTSSDPVPSHYRDATNPMGYPNAAVCCLSVKLGSGAIQFASGFFTTTTKIVTAAHALQPYADKLNRRLTKKLGLDVFDLPDTFEIFPALNGEDIDKPPVTIIAKGATAAFPSQWTTHKNHDRLYDVAVITLAKPPPPPADQDGFSLPSDIAALPICGFGLASGKQCLCNIIGYPYLGDDFPNQYSEDGQAYEVMAPQIGMKQSAELCIAHKLQTSGGSSGSPLFFQDPGNPQNWFVGAIHTDGIKLGGSFAGYNTAVIITKDLRDGFINKVLFDL